MGRTELEKLGAGQPALVHMRTAIIDIGVQLNPACCLSRTAKSTGDIVQ